LEIDYILWILEIDYILLKFGDRLYFMNFGDRLYFFVYLCSEFVWPMGYCYFGLQDLMAEWKLLGFLWMNDDLVYYAWFLCYLCLWHRFGCRCWFGEDYFNYLLEFITVEMSPVKVLIFEVGYAERAWDFWWYEVALLWMCFSMLRHYFWSVFWGIKLWIDFVSVNTVVWN